MDVRLLGNNTHTKNLHEELLLGKDEKEEVISINVRLNIIQPKMLPANNIEIQKVSYFSSASVDLKEQIVVSST